MTNAIDALMDELGIEADAHPGAEELLDRIEAHCGAPLAPAAATFLRRSLHQVELSVEIDDGHSILNTWEPALVAEWSWETERDDPYVARAVIFADDEGDFVFFVDPANRIGFGPEAVYLVEKGSMSIDAVELVAPDLEAFLGRYVRQEWPEPRNVLTLRDEQTGRSPPPLRTGNGRELAPDAVSDPRFFPGADVLRSVRVQRPLTIDGRAFAPKPDRRDWDTEPDLQFFPDGSVRQGIFAGGEVDGIPIVPGSRIYWKPDGELHIFTPATRVVIGGVACRAGAQVVRRASTGHFCFTPDEDTDYRGFPCKGGDKVDDYGPGHGLHFTSARRFEIAGRATVPRNVGVTIMPDGGARFELVVATMVDGRPLVPGTRVWYDGHGNVREIYVPKAKPR